MQSPSAPLRRACVIVDAYSAGALYPREAASRGIQAVHVMSSPHPGICFDPTSFMFCLAYEPDVGKLVAALREVCIPACVVAGSEGCVELADALAAMLQVLGNPPETSHWRRDKCEMVARVREAGLLTVGADLRLSHRNPLRRHSGEPSAWVESPRGD